MKESGNVTLLRLRKGECSEELGEAIATAVDRMKATGKKSKVILTLTFEPAGAEKGSKGEEIPMSFIRDDIKLVLPAMPRNDTLLFVDHENGGLTDENPQQHIDGVEKQAKVSKAG
jgi:hypothetical protein